MTEPTRPVAVRAVGPFPQATDELLPPAFAPVWESDASALRAIATMFAELGAQLHAPRSETCFAALTRVAAAQIAGTRSASVTTLRAGKFRTEAATDDLSRRGDALQYELGSGPCIDAIVDSAVYHPIDLRHDERWPAFGRRAWSELGVASMVSYRLSADFLPDEMIAGLNLYSDELDAFTSTAVWIGSLLATHGAAAIAAELNRDKAVNLEHALGTNREIGVAMGVLMARYRVTREQALDLLRITSQRSNRKLRDIATEVADTGILRGIPT